VLQTGKDVLGVAKQTAKGAIAANPAFAHGLTGGGLSVAITQEADAITSAYLAAAGAFREKAENGASIETRAWVKGLGLYLLAALGAVSTTGTGPYVHVFTLGSSLPYLTIFEKKGDNTIAAIRDCKIDELEIAWEENAPLTVSVKANGTALSFPASFTPTVDESDGAAYFAPVGGTFKYDVDSATPVVASIKGGKVAIKRGVEAKYYSGTIEAGDVHEGACVAEVSFTVEPDDLGLWRTIVTGSSSGAGVQSTPLYGSFEFTFVNGSASLKLEANRVAFLCEMPEADPEGGAAESELSGICYRNTATPITATLTNQQATY